MPQDITFVVGHDREGFYVDGNRILEAPILLKFDVLQALGIPFRVVYMDDDWLEEQEILPTNLGNIKMDEQKMDDPPPIPRPPRPPRPKPVDPGRPEPVEPVRPEPVVVPGPNPITPGPRPEQPVVPVIPESNDGPVGPPPPPIPTPVPISPVNPKPSRE